MHLLAEMSLGQWALAFLVVCVCLFLILVILLQRGRGGGLAGAFGGGGGSSAFGAKTGDVFTWITVGFAGVFLLLAIAGNFVFRPTSLAIADPPAATAPGDGQGQTITLPLEDGATGEGFKVEMVTPDGQVVPVDAATEPVPDGTQPQQPAAQPAPNSADPQQPATDPVPPGENPPPSDPSSNDNGGADNSGAGATDDTGPGRG